ncbi:hypothetical protein [Bradyrhizobium genosp. A]|uniref:hypothetical protein n=1 Tax=Bradyrhizobium genosp. A TaxID=83626 RepID=UPI003CF9F6E0
MQKPYEYTLTASDRATLSTWLSRIFAFYCVVILIIGLALAGPRVALDGERQATVSISQTDPRSANSASRATSPSDSFSIEMPLP